MEEKYIVNDVLNGVKECLLSYQRIISQTENLKLRQSLQEIRDNNESFQYEILKIAEVKGYYNDPHKADQNQINSMKNEVDF